MSLKLIKGATIVNEEKIWQADVLVENDLIVQISESITCLQTHDLIDAEGLYLIPGIIDDQVHFREPGLTQKAEIYTEAKAAVAGGITSFMEMPNTVPNTTTQELLEDKYVLAANKSLANFSFYMGATNTNLDEVLKTDASKVCGVKVFMGSSTGNMLVDNEVTLGRLFSECDMLIATHCEDEETVRNNLATYIERYGEDIPLKYHPQIRSREACYISSSMAVELAKQHNSRLHVLHISTAEETELFDSNIPLKEKRITSEACVHHLWFTDKDYEKLQTRIKWNPAVKTARDRDAILKAVLSNKIDVIATDHAPHVLNEKLNVYTKAPSGGPLVQHALNMVWELYEKGELKITDLVNKMCHAPATCFQIEGRGFIREGYFADLVLVDPKDPWMVKPENILYKCGWSPLEGHTFSSRVKHTFVSGHLAYSNGRFDETQKGKRLTFKRR